MLILLKKMRKRERLLSVMCVLFVLGRCWLELQLPGYMKDLAMLIQTPGTPSAMVWKVGRKMLECVMGRFMLAIPSGWCAAQAAAGFAYTLRETVFGKAMELSKPEVDAFSVHRLLDCTTEDVRKLQQMLNEGLQVLVPTVVICLLTVLRIIGRNGLAGEWIELGGYAFFVFLALGEAAATLQWYPAVRLSAGRILDVLDAQTSVLPGEKTQGREVGTLNFHQVSFAYPGEKHSVVQDISFRVEPGQTVAIVGASDSGKSALAELAARLYDPDEGQICVDGLELREYAFETLYNKLSYVPQRAALFSGSVRSNVFFGESEIIHREEDLKAVLMEIPGEILPERVDESGETLSDGQRQRLGIARALARRPEILILNDCFEGLDIPTCKGLLEGLDQTTVLLITQQTGLARMADHIVVLEQGKLVGQGTHEQLVKACPGYRALLPDGQEAEP